MGSHAPPPTLSEEVLSVFPADRDIYCITAQTLQALPPVVAKQLVAAIDQMGQLSARAQGLQVRNSNRGQGFGAVGSPAAVTSGAALRNNKDHTYVCIHQGCLLGLLRVGPKSLFYTSREGKLVKIYPLCALDFYVHEAAQRGGIGRRLFDEMLHCEGAVPSQVAIDAPSPKFRAFMGKHFALTEFFEQSNKFVVFDAFFRTDERGQLVAATPPYQPQETVGKQLFARTQSRQKTVSDKLQEIHNRSPRSS